MSFGAGIPPTPPTNISSCGLENENFVFEESKPTPEFR